MYISEIESTLNYPRIWRKYAVTDQDVKQLRTLLERDALLVSGDAPVNGAIPEDPPNERVLACALEASADLTVSGDLHLLDLESYQGIPIVTARAFLERLEAEETE